MIATSINFLKFLKEKDGSKYQAPKHQAYGIKSKTGVLSKYVPPWQVVATLFPPETAYCEKLSSVGLIGKALMSWCQSLFLFTGKWLLISPSFFVLDQANELSLNQLPIEVGDRILERVLVSLVALALVTASLEASA